MESIGKYLQETRESKNISQEKAAKESKISLEHIKQIEADEFNKISGMTYIKGFLKQYGDYLGLDGKVLIEEYIKIYGNKDKNQDKISLVSNYQRMELTLMTLQKWVPIVNKLIVFTLIALILFIGFKFMPSVTVPVKSFISKTFTKKTKTAAKPKEAAKSSILDDIEAIEQKNSGNKKIRQTEVTEEGVLSTVTLNQKINTTATVVITADKNVWLTIRIDNKLIMDGLLSAGETERINEAALIEITSNNPASTSVMYKKKEIVDFKNQNSHAILKIENGEISIEN